MAGTTDDETLLLARTERLVLSQTEIGMTLRASAAAPAPATARGDDVDPSDLPRITLDTRGDAAIPLERVHRPDLAIQATLGEGGMGRVHLARRRGEDPRGRRHAGNCACAPPRGADHRDARASGRHPREGRAREEAKGKDRERLERIDRDLDPSEHARRRTLPLIMIAVVLGAIGIYLTFISASITPARRPGRTRDPRDARERPRTVILATGLVLLYVVPAYAPHVFTASTFLNVIVGTFIMERVRPNRA